MLYLKSICLKIEGSKFESLSGRQNVQNKKVNNLSNIVPTKHIMHISVFRIYLVTYNLAK